MKPPTLGRRVGALKFPGSGLEKGSFKDSCCYAFNKGDKECNAIFQVVTGVLRVLLLA